MSDTVVRIVIDASQASRGGSQAERALDRVGASTRRLDGALGRTTVNISTFGRSLAGLKGAGGALVLADLTRRAIEAADGFALMDAKLKVATKNWGDHTRAQEDAMRIARTTRSELTSTAVLYGKLATTSKTLNASQAQVATATETVTKALKVSGASAGETASTVLQLGQALASGRLNGDEFRSLAENAPRLIEEMLQLTSRVTEAEAKVAGIDIDRPIEAGLAEIRRTIAGLDFASAESVDTKIANYGKGVSAWQVEEECQTAFKRDPRSASKRDPLFR